MQTQREGDAPQSRLKKLGELLRLVREALLPDEEVPPFPSEVASSLLLGAEVCAAGRSTGDEAATRAPGDEAAGRASGDGAAGQSSGEEVGAPATEAEPAVAAAAGEADGSADGAADAGEAATTAAARAGRTEEEEAPKRSDAPLHASREGCAGGVFRGRVPRSTGRGERLARLGLRSSSREK